MLTQLLITFKLVAQNVKLRFKLALLKRRKRALVRVLFGRHFRCMFDALTNERVP